MIEQSIKHFHFRGSKEHFETHGYFYVTASEILSKQSQHDEESFVQFVETVKKYKSKFLAME